MSMTHETAVRNPELQTTLAALYRFVQQAARDGTPVPEVERGIWAQILRLGRLALQNFFTLLGSGDQGETLPLPDGQSLDRLPEPHPRRSVSIFGEFVLCRTA